MPYGHIQTVPSFTSSATISATAAANLLIVAVVWEDVVGTNPAFSGYTQIGTKVTNSQNYSGLLFYLPNNPGALTNVTATWDNGTPSGIDLRVSEYAGIATSGPLIGHSYQAQTSPGTSIDAISSGVVNVTAQPALIYGVAIDQQGGTDVTAGTGFTSRYSTWGEVEEKRVTATGNQAATFTAATNPGTIIALMAAFAESGGTNIAAIAAHYRRMNSGW